MADQPPASKASAHEQDDAKQDDATADMTDDQLKVYVIDRYNEYASSGFIDRDLWEYFQADFGNWPEARWTRAPQNPLMRLRKVLRANGVWVSRKDRVRMTKALFDTATEETQHEWTSEEIDEQVNKEGGLTSYLTRLRREPNLTPVSSHKSASHAQPQDAQPEYAQPQDVQLHLEQSLAEQRELQKKRHETVEKQRQAQRQRQEDIPENLPFDDGDPNFGQDLLQQRQHLNRLKDPDFPPPRPAGTGRELANLAKSYTDMSKYGGSKDRFDFKLTIFKAMCERCNLPQDRWIQGLPIMLKGDAEKYYYQSIYPKITDMVPFESIIAKLKVNFEGIEYQRGILQEWQDTSLQKIVQENPQQSISQNLESLLSQLRDLQLGLAPRFRDEEFLYIKTIEACKKVPACRLACFKPSLTLEGLITDLRTSVALQGESPEQLTHEDAEQLYTDRRYKGHRPQNRDRFQKKDSGIAASPANTSAKACFICKKIGCWSTKHTSEERKKHREDFQKQVNRRFDQYMAEGDDEEPQQSSDSELEAFMTSLDVNDKSETFLTSCGSINGTEMTQYLAETTTYHLLTAEHTQDKNDEEPTEIFLSSKRYDDSQFQGVLVDTGASQRSTAGYQQCVAYQRLHPEVKIKEGSGAPIKFGIGEATPKGTITVLTAIGIVDFHVVDAVTPFLLCLQDMDRLQVKYDNLRNVLIQGDRAHRVTRRYGHAFLPDPKEALFETFLSTQELQQLHRRFGHPSANRLYTLLQKSEHEVDRKAIEKLTNYCTTCQKNGRSPRRFKFTLKDDSIDFNHSIYVDIMYIDSSPALHVIDEATRYQAGRWVKDMSTSTTWNAIRACWIDVYVGPPDLLVHDAGTNFTSQEFQQLAKSMAIETKCVPVEAHNSMGIVERYHHPLRRAYQVISEDLQGTPKDVLLQMAFKAVNDTAGPDGLVPTLLVYGCYPRMAASDPPHPSIPLRAKAIAKAMEEVSKLRDKRQITEALRQRNGPDTGQVKALALNSDVLVYRDNNNSQRWEGPFKLIAIEGESCKIELPRGPTTFRITSVKPFLQLRDQDTPAQADLPQEHPQEDPRSNPTRNRRLPGRYTEIETYTTAISAPWTNQIAEARRKELTDLLEKQVFELVDITDVPVGMRVFGTKWVDTIKNEGTPMAYAKARLVIQAFNDLGKAEVLTQSPTIQRASQRIILSIAASLPDTSLYLRDISQAYVQSLTPINRLFYAKPPREAGLPSNTIYRVSKPLYGIPEAGNHWYKTYSDHHINTLGMKPSAHDSCLLYRAKDDRSKGFGTVGLQTDDTLILANDAFAKTEDSNTPFLCKEREKLTVDHPLGFNGGLIQIEDDSLIVLNQQKHCDKIQIVNSKESYVAQRALGAYIATVCQPESAFDLSFAAQITELQDFSALNKRLQWQKENSTRGLKFKQLHLPSTRLVAFADSSFANNKDYSSQIGFVVAMVDKDGNANTIHWQSIKCKRVTRSVLASELYAFALAFDHASALNQSIQAILNQRIPLVLMTDSRSLYDCLTKLNTTNEKRLMIDIMGIREAYEKREITEIRWTNGKSNPADAMTKGTPSKALQDLIDTNHVDLRTTEWVERKGDGGSTEGTN